MLDWIFNIWNCISPELRPAIVGSVTTVFTAAIGIGLVIWQISRQATHALKQSKHNEAMKLKLDIYRDFLAGCRSAEDVVIKFTTTIRLVPNGLRIARRQFENGHTTATTADRIPKIMEQNRDAGESVINLMEHIEGWEIVDPRLRLFRLAFHSANHDIRERWPAYFDALREILPIENPNDESGKTLYPWQPPSEENIENFDQLGQQLLYELGELLSYIGDLRVEMQNLLLGELFQNTVARREPLDPKHKVIRLDNIEELERYFVHESKWGRHTKEIDRSVVRAVEERARDTKGDKQ